MVQYRELARSNTPLNKASRANKYFRTSDFMLSKVLKEGPCAVIRIQLI